MLLIVYVICSFFVGFVLVKKVLSVFPKLLQFVGAFLLGTIISTVAVYELAVLFKSVSDPVNAAIIVFCAVTAILMLIYFKKYHGFIHSLRIHQFLVTDVVVVIFSLVFASYIMMKTFRYGIGSTLLIGSNEVFDFGHALSIVRSFSWGHNIPFLSPFVTGAPHLYHFMFYFYAAIYEHLGIPLVYALNIPSVLSFTAMLICIYYLPQVLIKSSRTIGIFAMLLTITHSTATFILYLFQKGFSFLLFSDIWRLSKYLYAAPYDSSNISLFWTLNVFVNQRHLAIGIATTLLLIMGVVAYIQKRKTIPLFSICLFGIITGMLILWHMMMSVACFVIIVGILLFEKQWKNSLSYISITLLSWLLCMFLWISVIVQYIFSSTHAAAVQQINSVNSYASLASWLILNLGISLVTIVGGYIVLKEKRFAIIPPGILIIAAVFVNYIAGAQSYQKFMNIWIIFANVLTASFLVWIWKKNLIGKLLTCGFLVLLTGSGIMDFMVIKNDFMYPVIDAPDNKLIQWIKENTSPSSVFLSYADIFDPVTLSGRNNYSGFFRHIGQPDRRNNVKQLYELRESKDISAISSYGIDYVVIPLWDKNDFSYTIDNGLFREALKVVYENDKHIILKTK